MVCPGALNLIPSYNSAAWRGQKKEDIHNYGNSEERFFVLVLIKLEITSTQRIILSMDNMWQTIIQTKVIDVIERDRQKESKNREARETKERWIGTEGKGGSKTERSVSMT